jgi:hypothetical protein
MTLLALPGITEILIGVVLSIAIIFFVLRWIFRVDAIADNLKIQAHLLIRIAKHNTVTTEEINKGITREKFPMVGGQLQKKEI